MKTTILVAGATGDLGGRIVKALLQRGATVRAVVRQGSDKAKVDQLTQSGVGVVHANMNSVEDLTKACAGAGCVVSALQGLRDVIVDVQGTLLQAAVAAGVPRFIPSDYSSDFTQLPRGENRNFDLRREFHDVLDKAPIKSTAIFNGAFAELLQYNIPFLDFKKKMVGYWEDPNWKVDFTTMDNAAAYTAAAALDADAPAELRIASFQVSANEMAEIAKEVTGETFNIVRMGGREDLAAKIKQDRATHPEGEQEVYPNWQRSQYMLSMFSSQMPELDNDRYEGIEWTGVRALLAGMR